MSLQYFDNRGILCIDIVKELYKCDPDKASAKLQKFKSAASWPLDILSGSYNRNGRWRVGLFISKRSHFDHLYKKCQSEDLKKQFWDKHGSFIQQHFPAHSNSNSCSHANAHANSTAVPVSCTQSQGEQVPISKLALPTYYELLEDVYEHPTGEITATAKDFQTFQQFLQKLQTHTGATYAVSSYKYRKQRITQEYVCKLGGKASFLYRRTRKHKTVFTRQAAAGKSKKVGCTAKIITKLSKPYAVSLGLCTDKQQPQPESDDDSDTDDEHVHATDSDDGDEPSASVPPAANAGDSHAQGAAGSSQQDTAVRLWLFLHHKGHTPLSAMDLLSQPVHPEVVQKIEELALQETNFRALCNLLNQHADQLVQRLQLSVDRDVDVRFYPREETIRNIQAAAVHKARLHKVDQAAVAKLVERYRARQPGDNWFFQQSGPSSKMLLVSQTAKQRRMLKLYGGKIVGLDATYKTTKWGFPMFLLNVVTNHRKGYPVGIFFVQEESTDMIAQALQLFKEWNPDWKPEYFMVDKSDQEINAVKQVFKKCEVLLCDFHRLQAQWRWINTATNGVPAAKKLQVYQHFKDLADAESVAVYEQRLAKLQSLPEYVANDKLQHYLEKEWLPCAEMWASCYRRAYHGGINTNNYMESMNRVFKYKWLNDRIDRRLDSLLRIYFDNILPWYNRKYQIENILSVREQHMTRQTPLEDWAVGRPKPVVELLRLRQKKSSDLVVLPGSAPGEFLLEKSEETLSAMLQNDKAAELVPAGMTLQQYKQELTVEDKHYSTSIIAGSCSCADFSTNQLVCKHMFAVSRHTGCSLTQLPDSFSKQPHLVIDSEMVDMQSIPTAQFLGALIEDLQTEGDMVLQAEDLDMSEELADEIALADRLPTSNAKMQFLDAAHAIRTAAHSLPEDVMLQLLPELTELQAKIAAAMPAAAFNSESAQRATAHGNRPAKKRPADGIQPSQVVAKSNQRQAKQPAANLADSDAENNVPEFTQVRGPGRPKAAEKKRAFPAVRKAGPTPASPQQTQAEQQNALQPSAKQNNPTAAPSAQGNTGHTTAPARQAQPQGRLPNPNYLAIPQQQVDEHPLYLSLPKQWQAARLTEQQIQTLPSHMQPQGTATWHNLRAHLVTGSILGSILGFSETNTVKLLSVPASMEGHGKTVASYTSVQSPPAVASPESPVAIPLAWGSAHEPNARMVVLKNSATIFPGSNSLCLCQQGLYILDPTKFPPDVVIGVDVTALPKLGSSPDDLAIMVSSKGERVFTVMEYKTKCPFLGANQEGVYTFNDKVAFPKVIPAHHYAQVQLAMLATQAQKCILVQCGVNNSSVKEVAFSGQWCNSMLKVLAQLQQSYLAKQAVPGPHDFSTLAGYADFISITKEKLSDVKEVCKFASEKNLHEAAMFLQT